MLVEQAKQFLESHELTPDQLHEAIHLFLIADGLKTGAFITAEDEEAPVIESLMNELNLAWRSKPLNNDGTGKSYTVANSQQLLDKYLAAERAMVERNSPALEADWERTNGQFLGYPASSVQAFEDQIRSGQWPHPFWTEIEAGKSVSDAIALAMEATDVIPSSTADTEVEQLGERIHELLDTIDPLLAPSFIQQRQRYLHEKRMENHDEHPTT